MAVHELETQSTILRRWLIGECEVGIDGAGGKPTDLRAAEVCEVLAAHLREKHAVRSSDSSVTAPAERATPGGDSE